MKVMAASIHETLGAKTDRTPSPKSLPTPGCRRAARIILLGNHPKWTPLVDAAIQARGDYVRTVETPDEIPIAVKSEGEDGADVVVVVPDEGQELSPDVITDTDRSVSFVIVSELVDLEPLQEAGHDGWYKNRVVAVDPAGLLPDHPEQNPATTAHLEAARYRSWTEVMPLVI